MFIQAVDSGKIVQVTDKITQTIVFNRFLDMAEEAVAINVASYDDKEGRVEIMKGASPPPNTYSKTDYPVKKDEIITISDGQD